MQPGRWEGPFYFLFLSPPEFILSLWGSQVQRHAKCIKTFPIKSLSPPGGAGPIWERAGSAGSASDFQDCVWQIVCTAPKTIP